MPGIWKHDSARIVAVCDLDSKRVEEAKVLVNGQYSKQTGKPYDGVTTYTAYRELLANKDIDAVVISTPDHWHALIAIDAVQAGKDVYLQKPASLTVAEGRALSDAVHRSGRVFQIGSQQRSWPQGQFRRACELVRNGRIGQLKTVEVGLPGDPSGPVEPEMPVPKNLNYDGWLGSTPVVYYTENRVHPQNGYGRPGWLREATERWLDEHGLGGHRLVMRSPRDRAPARVVKPQLVARLADGRTVGIVVDDDEEVLEAMRGRGWPVFHADWERRAVEEEAALRQAQETEGRT